MIDSGHEKFPGLNENYIEILITCFLQRLNIKSEKILKVLKTFYWQFLGYAIRPFY